MSLFMSVCTYTINLPNLYKDLQDMRYEYYATPDILTLHI